MTTNESWSIFNFKPCKNLVNLVNLVNHIRTYTHTHIHTYTHTHIHTYTHTHIHTYTHTHIHTYAHTHMGGGGGQPHFCQCCLMTPSFFHNWHKSAKIGINWRKLKYMHTLL